LIDLPVTPVPPAVSVADSVVVPPKVPDAAATASEVLVRRREQARNSASS
jgi:hypothetical protein